MLIQHFKLYKISIFTTMVQNNIKTKIVSYAVYDIEYWIPNDCGPNIIFRVWFLCISSIIKCIKQHSPFEMHLSVPSWWNVEIKAIFNFLASIWYAEYALGVFHMIHQGKVITVDKRISASGASWNEAECHCIAMGIGKIYVSRFRVIRKV